MEIQAVASDRWRYRDLLLLADEQQDMVARYIDRGDMYVLFADDGCAVAECLVTDEGSGVLELKSIAVAPDYQGRGYGRTLVAFIEDAYAGRFATFRVGTGESPLTLGFYRHLGFEERFRVKDFFSDNYDHPIVEAGVTLRDMVYLEKPLGHRATSALMEKGDVR